MHPVVVTVTGENQTTLPGALMRELGMPYHFKVFVHDGDLTLFSARLATYDEQARAADTPALVLRRAYASAAGQEAVEEGERDGGS